MLKPSAGRIAGQGAGEQAGGGRDGWRAYSTSHRQPAGTPPAARMMTHEPRMAAMAGGPTAHHIASLVAPPRQRG